MFILVGVTESIIAVLVEVVVEVMVVVPVKGQVVMVEGSKVVQSDKY